MDCNCPAATSLLEIVAEACGVNMSQIQKMAFQRQQATPTFTSTTILLLATWQALMTVNDDTKIVVTPFISADPIIEAGEAITTGGGDNSTLNGVEELEGVNPSKFSCTFKSLSTALEVAMKALMCETGLTVYFFVKGGKIVCVNVAANAYGFTVQSFFLSDRNNSGFGTKDTFKCSFSLPDGWSEKLKIYEPTAFNPLTDL